MSDASVVFLPWVRQGLAARIATPDPLKTPLPAQAPLGVALGVNNVDAASVGVRLFGPADVIGIDPRQVVRTEPPAGTDNYESNDLAAVEFDNPDLPWLFTPAAADGQGRVRPWIVLVVVRKQDGVRLRPPRTELLPVLEIGAPAVPSQELPDLVDSWAWAHAQLGAHVGATEGELRDVLVNYPQLVGLASAVAAAAHEEHRIHRVRGARVRSGTARGTRRHTGRRTRRSSPHGAAAPNAPGNVSLPVYYHWEFRTGAARRFRIDRRASCSRAISRIPSAGVRWISARPGFIVPQTTPPTVIPPVMLEGALQPVGAPRAAFPDDTTKTWQQKLQSIVNVARRERTGRERRAGARSADLRPLLCGPQ